MILKTSTTQPLTFCMKGKRLRVMSIIPNGFMSRIFTKSHLNSHWLRAVISSWEIDGETVETVSDFIFWGSKITADGDCSHEIKRRLLLGRKVIPT